MSGLHGGITIFVSAWVRRSSRLLLVSVHRRPLDPLSLAANLVVVGSVLVAIVVVDCGGFGLVLVEKSEEVATQPIAGICVFCFALMLYFSVCLCFVCL